MACNDKVHKHILENYQGLCLSLKTNMLADSKFNEEKVALSFLHYFMSLLLAIMLALSRDL